MIRPAPRRRRAVVLAVGVLLILAGACTPYLQQSGPFDRPPLIESNQFIARDGARLPLRVWLPDGTPRAVVVALHGFNDYSRAFEDPAKAWAARGIATYAIDQRGFGAAPEPGIWAGTQAMTDDLTALFAVAARRHPGTPVFVAGDSMGGAVVLTALAAHPELKPAGALLIAPALWGRAYMGPFKGAALWLTAHTVPWFRVTAEGLDVTPSDNEAMLRRLAEDPLVIKETRIDSIWGLVNLMDAAQAATSQVKGPVLLLYGMHDEVIPPEPTWDAISRLSANGRTRAAFYNSGYHMLLRDLGAAKPTADAAAWLLDPQHAQPTHADRLLPAAP